MKPDRQDELLAELRSINPSAATSWDQERAQQQPRQPNQQQSGLPYQQQAGQSYTENLDQATNPELNARLNKIIAVLQQVAPRACAQHQLG